MTMRVASPPSAEIASRAQLRAGWILSILLGLFLAVDGIGRILKLDQYEEGTIEAGFQASQGPLIGIILLACTVLYLVPRTAFFGAILLSAYFGGAVVAALQNETYGPVLFAVAFGIIAWVGLALRDARMRQIIT